MVGHAIFRLVVLSALFGSFFTVRWIYQQLTATKR